MYRAYLIRRVGLAVIVTFILVLFVSLLPRLLPGDPVVTILGPRASPELIAQVRGDMELDKSVPIQLWNFFARALHGDLGRDFTTQTPIASLILEALPQTVVLAISAMLLAIVIGIPLGTLGAIRANSWLDGAIGAVSVALITIPPYVVGLTLLLFFAIMLRWVPAVGAGTLSSPGDYLLRLLLPAVSLSFAWMGYLGRLVRASMLDVLNAEYIRAARALGLSERVVILQYALRNALIPSVAVIGFGLGNLLGSAVFIEIIFARPGLGMLVFNAVEQRNYPVLRAAVIVIGVLYAAAALLADIVQHKLDPRINLAQSDT
jgi:peptide/nickel transport system permease protein